MSVAILGKCPGCKRTLRLPEEAAGKTVRCRHCGMIAQANPTARLQARSAAAIQSASVAAVPVVHPVAAAPLNITAAAPAPQSADAWSAIADEAFNDTTPAAKYRHRKGGWITAILALLFLAGCLGGTAAAVYLLMPKIKEKMAEQEEAQRNAAETPKSGPKGNPDQIVVAGGNQPFPRRLLGISVNNYIYANPTSYGYDPGGLIKRDFGKTLEKLANKLRVPEGQVFELSDGAPKKANPPVKPIFEQTLTRFLES